MNNCSEFIELISAYADGELTESDSKRVESHLASCEKCSALLELYREISVAEHESNAPAPDALRDGVMEKVLNFDAAHTKDAVKHRSTVRMILTRYVPMAACLAATLLILPRVVNFSINYSSSDNAAPLSMQSRNATDMDWSEPQAAPEMAIDQSEDDYYSHFVNGAPAPAEPVTTTDKVDRDEVLTNERGGESDAGTTAPGSAGSSSEPPQQANPDYNSGGTQNTPDTSNSSSSTPGNESENWQPDDTDNLEDAGLINPGPPEFDTLINGANALVMITGRLPEILSGYDLESLGSWRQWESLYMIQGAAASDLLSALVGSDGVEIIYNGSGGDYIVVMHSP